MNARLRQKLTERLSMNVYVLASFAEIHSDNCTQISNEIVGCGDLKTALRFTPRYKTLLFVFDWYFSKIEESLVNLSSGFL